MRSRGRILIVDDEANARAALAEILREEGYATEMAADGFKALGKLAEFTPEVVLTDLKMPGLTGIGLMEKARELLPHATFVVMTAFGTIQNAVEAVQKGAFHYLTKPLDFAQLLTVVERAVEHGRLQSENARLRDRLREKNASRQIIARDPKMLAVLQLADQVAASKTTVLVTGDTGTGKELVADLIHAGSPRKDKAMVRVNCAALSETLLESELFGHERGAFTGAFARRDGRFQQADGSTLFLDEVSEIPLALQVKLLRVLQERTFERVGGNETQRVDVRIIAATNRDLGAAVTAGRFREDLLYRLNVFSLEIPRLSDRPGDIPELASYFLQKLASENQKRIDGLSDDAHRALAVYAWPGNVRELQNVIERAVVLCDGTLVEPRHLPTAIAGAQNNAPPTIPGATLFDLERYAILKTLEACKGSTSRAAAMLGISARKVQYKLREYTSGDDAATRQAAPQGPEDEETS